MNIIVFGAAGWLGWHPRGSNGFLLLNQGFMNEGFTSGGDHREVLYS